jgi:hypothetical protein
MDTRSEYQQWRDELAGKRVRPDWVGTAIIAATMAAIAASVALCVLVAQHGA